EEPPVARVMAHVADRVDVDEQADRQDDDEQAGRQVVDEEADVDVELVGWNPVVDRDPVAAVREWRKTEQRGEGHDNPDAPRDPDRPDRHEMGTLAEAAPPDGGEEEAGQRQGDDQGDEQVEHHWLIASYSSTSGVF